MATKKKMLQAAAGNAGGAGLNVEDVFSTYLYDGTGSTQTITNGIDLDGEGGAILTKRRDSTSGSGPWFNDTERGITKYISTSDTGAETDSAGSISAVTSSGYTLGTFSGWNNSAGEYVSWTFRKAPKFFDVVTYTGDGTTGKSLSHNLGVAPGVVIIKKTDAAANWYVYHRDIGTGKYLQLNLSDAQVTNSSYFVSASSTDFVLGSNGSVNGNGNSHVAYLFAHNDGDGEFGPDADADIIKCGSYTSNSGGEITVDLGFEPQWILLKNTAGRNAGWVILDTMRGFSTDAGNNLQLLANASYAELDVDEAGAPQPTATGFKLASSGQYAEYNYGTDEIIYIAIRRGTKVPESATEVFAPVFHNDDSSEINVSGGFTADAFISKRRSGTDTYMTPRLLGGQTLRPSSTAAEIGYSNFVSWDTQEGVNFTGWWGSVTDGIDWQWKRAPGFFDAVAYTGDGVAGRTVSHNLGAAPEMMWVKRRSGTGSWYVYGGDETKVAYLNSTSAFEGPSSAWASTAPTNTAFTVGSETSVNASGSTYIAYLFASLPGISKVGSYTGNGSSSGQNIDCGFTTGARFILLKRSDGTSNWVVFDTERGITIGDDPYVKLDVTDAETTNPFIDPYSSGFKLQGTIRNGSGENYIFYAIA